MVVTRQAVEAIEPEVIPPRLYGLIAEFDTASQLLQATRRAYAAGYRVMDAYAPFPVEGLSDALGFHPKAVPLIGLFGGMLGAATGYGMQYFIHVISLPINVGGRPLNSWVAFSIPTYETTILLAALLTVGGMLAISGLPMPYHPVFNVEAFRKTASSTGFFLCIEATDPRFDLARTRVFLEGLHPKAINEVNA